MTFWERRSADFTDQCWYSHGALSSPILVVCYVLANTWVVNWFSKFTLCGYNIRTHSDQMILLAVCGLVLAVYTGRVSHPTLFYFRVEGQDPTQRNQLNWNMFLLSYRKHLFRFFLIFSYRTFLKLTFLLIQIQERVNESDHFHEHLDSMIDSV